MWALKKDKRQMWTPVATSSPPPPPPPLSPPTGSASRHLRSLSSSSDFDRSLTLLESEPSPHPDSCSHLLHACITRRSLTHGLRLHRHLLRAAPHLLRHPTINAKLITLYSTCNHLSAARDAFDVGPQDPTSSAAMCVAYSTNGHHDQSLLFFADMQRRSVAINNFALSAALKACSQLSDLRLGQTLHAQILKSSDNIPDQVVLNGILSLYLQCGSSADALQVFDKMPQRNIVSWNSIISRLHKGGRLSESLKVFRRLQVEANLGFSCFNWVTLTTVLAVCSQLAALRSGKEIHAQIIRARASPDIIVMNSLMDMYAKCGAADASERVFGGMHDRDVTSWNVMLTAYSINGCPGDALGLFEQMVCMGIRPDGVTFIAVLSSCSHAGFTEEGRQLFDRMESDFRVSPTVEHYACLVDILGRAGRIGEAMDVIERMPMRPTSSVWGSLLHSCRIHGDIANGETAAERLLELEPDNAGNYVVLSNIYANARMWGEAKAVRERMQARDIKKEVGCSWIQIGSRIHRFVAGGSVDFRSSPEYKRIWGELMDTMKDAGYVPDCGTVLHDVDDEMKAMWICGHSEKIALVFGLIHSGEGMPIRIMKNLRVCLDCHNAMKMISRVRRRLIVLRDTTRFHHFSNGACSCRDFW